MSTSQIDQLRDALHREAQRIEPVSLGIEQVVSRGRHRRNRGRALVAVGAAACVTGVGVSVVEHGATPHRIAVAAPASSGGADTPALEFRVVDGTVAYSSAHFTTAAGVTYELSTAPGATAQGSGPGYPGQAIYSTSDGEHWTTADQGAAWITDLTERNGVLYAIGTAPGATKPDDVRYRVGTSHNGGAAWSDTDLPFDLTAPSANVTLYRSSAVHIASTPTATVAVLTEQFSPNLDSMVAARAAGHPNVEPRQTADGFSLFDMSACVAASGAARVKAADAAGALPVGKQGLAPECANPPSLGTITWADLGLSGPGELTREQTLVSTDGTHWDSAPAPTTAPIHDLAAGSGGFLLLADAGSPLGMQASDPSTTLLRSSDAHTWTKVDTPPSVNVQAIAGDRIVGYDQQGGVQTSTDGGVTWNTTDSKALLPAGSPAGSITTADAGPLGFAVVVTADADPKDQVRGDDYLLFSTDGVNWTANDLATAGAPAAGYPMQVTVGADHVGVDYELPGTIPGGPAKITTVLATPKR